MTLTEEATTPKEDITPEQDGGVFKEILRAGEGDEKPLAGDKVTVHYVGTLADGSKFDSSRDRGDKFEFDLGKGKVIKAWDIGVATMRRGELAKLTCRGDYAYGETGSPPKIPANATLIFEVELFDWKGEDLSEKKDGSVIKHLLQKGEGWQTPNDGATVKIHAVGRCGGNVFEDREVEFIVGESEDVGIIDGLELAVKKMNKNEKCKLEIQASKGYGATGNTDLNIPPNAVLNYDLELLSFEKAKESWEMNTEEKLEQAEIAKTKGTNYFKAEKYKNAVKCYKKTVDLLNQSVNSEDKEELKSKQDALMLAGHLNLAMCYLKLSDALQTEKSCDEALKLDDKNVKAYFRRGQAKQLKNEYDSARDDFQKVLELDATNKAAKNQLTVCTRKIKEFAQKEKQKYAGMFQKFAEQDSKNNQGQCFDGFANLGEWSNEMAAGMLPLEQEMAAFGEEMPPNKPQENVDQEKPMETDDATESSDSKDPVTA